MTKNLYQKFWIIIFILIQIFSFSPVATAELRDEIFVATTGYTILSPNNYIFSGFYGNNKEKRGFTTYFQFQKRGSANQSDPDFVNLPFEETIEIVRNSSNDTYGDFYSSPELKMFSTYYFRAVGYFNDKPEEKIYGFHMTLTTGYLPNGNLFEVGSSPVFVNRNYAVDSDTKFTKPCRDEDLKDGCVITRSLVCPEGHTAVEGSCISLAKIEQDKFDACMEDLKDTVACGRDVTTSCVSPKVFSNGECKGPDENGDVTIDDTDTTGGESQFDPILDGNGGGGGGTGENGLVKCGLRDADGTISNPCGFNNFIDLINDIITFIIVNLAIPIAAIMFAYAGFLLVTSGGATEKKEEAKKIFTNVAIGIILVAGAFLIVQTILMLIGLDPDSGIQWFGLLD